MEGSAVDGDEGRSGCFEVVVDGKFLAWSKLEAAAFPDFDALADQIKAYTADKTKVPASWSEVSKK